MSNTLKTDAVTSSDELAIRSLVETWHRATGAGEIDKVAELIAEDAIFLTPERPPIRGRQAFMMNLKKVLQSHSLTSRGDIRELVVSGTFAYGWIDLSVTMSPLDGTPPNVRRGATLSIFRKQADESWQLVRDANMLVGDSSELALKVDGLQRELMADGPGG